MFNFHFSPTHQNYPVSVLIYLNVRLHIIVYLKQIEANSVRLLVGLGKIKILHTNSPPKSLIIILTEALSNVLSPQAKTGNP